MEAVRYRRIVLFQNPASGLPNPELRRRIHERLETIGDSILEVVVERDLNLAARAAEIAKENVDLVVVAGGDGTVREVAAALVSTDVTLAIVPMGTFNNLALSLQLPKNPDAVCDLIEGGQTRRIDVGIADGRHAFFEGAGVGVDADLFPIGEEVKAGRFHGIGRAVRLALLHRQAAVELRFEGPVAAAYKRSFRGAAPLKRRRRRFLGAKNRVRLRCSLVVIGNGPYYGGNFNVCPGAALDDGLFSIAVYRDFSKLELLRHFWAISGGHRHYDPKMEMFTASRVEIWSGKRLSVHVDGHPIGTTPVRFDVLPRALKVITSPVG
ncbi:MAG TPA: diacylglycerol kinase family protein [Chthoniobacterales bacterium]|nr:diacylglycerol kinase family protein [Chthoniobacterales bacterium]